jgi:hypothetical protein
MNEYLKIIERLQNELDTIFSKIDLNIPIAQNDLFEQIMQFVGKLSTKKNNLIASVQNLKLLNQFKIELNEVINNSPELDKVIREFTKGLEISTKYVNDYFASMIVGFSANELLYKTLSQQIIVDTIDLLKGSGMQVTLTDPILGILRRNITTASSYKDLRKEIFENVKGTRLEKYTKQITNDAVMTYERNYMTSIAQDLGMDYFFYQGTEKNTTRSFCQNKIGKFFTGAEVRLWASQNWQGKRQGTNDSNIFYFAGGYNCRHRILPI